MKRTSLFLSIFLITTQAFACSGTGPAGIDDPECEPTQPANPFVFPGTIYTGFNGRDSYTSAVSANFNVDSWEVVDTSVATIMPLDNCQTDDLLQVAALLDIVGPGTTQVVATSGGDEYMSVLQAQTYTTEQYDVGARVYMEASADGTRPSCGSCHLSADGADHTPLITAYFSDEVLLQVITQGVYPDCLNGVDGTECECGSDFLCYELTEDERVLDLQHDWNLDAEEMDGVVSYLRGLRPRGF